MKAVFKNTRLEFLHQVKEYALTDAYTDSNRMIDNYRTDKSNGNLISQNNIFVYLYDISDVPTIFGKINAEVSITCSMNFSNACVAFYSDKPTSENDTDTFLGCDENFVPTNNYVKQKTNVPNGTKWIAITSLGKYSKTNLVYVKY